MKIPQNRVFTPVLKALDADIKKLKKTLKEIIETMDKIIALLRAKDFDENLLKDRNERLSVLESSSR